MLRNLLLLLSTAVGEIMAADGRFSELSTNVMVHVEAVIVTTLITIARVYKRQTHEVLPAACYAGCGKCITPRSHCLQSARLANQYMSGTDQALILAEDTGKNPAICLPNGNFSIALLKCEDCLSSHVTNSETVEVGAVLQSLDAFLSYCNDTSALASFSSLLNVEASVSIIQASLCSVNNITSDCSTTSSRNVTVATISPKPAAASTSVAASSAASTLVAASSTASTLVAASSTASTLVAASSAATSHSVASTLPLSAGAIAGVAVACTLAVVFIIALVIFLCFRRRKRHKQDKIRKAETANRQEIEKAQLHSEDLKPIRKELSGDQPLAGKKDVPIAEMPANEDSQRTTGEMPANEAVGGELQGESSGERNEEKGSSNTACQSN
jgi:hypothetical protein